jgi:hypothetical protein
MLLFGLVHIFSAIESCTSYKPWYDKKTGNTFLNNMFQYDEQRRTGNTQGALATQKQPADFKARIDYEQPPRFVCP